VDLTQPTHTACHAPRRKFLTWTGSIETAESFGLLLRFLPEALSPHVPWRDSPQILSCCRRERYRLAVRRRPHCGEVTGKRGEGRRWSLTGNQIKSSTINVDNTASMVNPSLASTPRMPCPSRRRPCADGDLIPRRNRSRDYSLPHGHLLSRSTAWGP
jgi:hypothetical protein